MSDETPESVAPEPTAQQALNILAGALDHPSLTLTKRDFLLIEKCLAVLATVVEDADKPATNGNRAARRHPEKVG